MRTATWDHWWQSIRQSELTPRRTVAGLRKTGKTTFFRALAEDTTERVFYWDVAPEASRTSKASIWGALWKVLGVTPEAREDPEAVLFRFLDDYAEDEDSPVLVVDHWDSAVTRSQPDAPVQPNETCAEVLFELLEIIVRQDGERAGESRLGLLLVTGVTSAEDLLHFSSRSQRVQFQRLSGLLTRVCPFTPFPYLRGDDVPAFLEGRDLSGAQISDVATQCGGWPGLMLLYADHLEARDGQGDLARLEGLVRRLVEDALQPAANRQRIEGRKDADIIDYTLGRISQTGRATDFGLPGGSGEGTPLPPLLQYILGRACLIVDTENLLVAFARFEKWHCFGGEGAPLPSPYEPSLEAFLRGTVGAWIQHIRSIHGVRPEDTWLVGVGRTDRLFGNDDAFAGERLDVPAAQLEKERRAERDGPVRGADDSIIMGKVGLIAGAMPHATIVLVSEDGDCPILAEVLEVSKNLVVYTPWAAARRIRGLGLKGLYENQLEVRGVSRPREIKAAEYAKALANEKAFRGEQRRLRNRG